MFIIEAYENLDGRFVKDCIEHMDHTPDIKYNIGKDFNP